MYASDIHINHYNPVLLRVRMYTVCERGIAGWSGVTSLVVVFTCICNFKIKVVPISLKYQIFILLWSLCKKSRFSFLAFLQC